MAFWGGGVGIGGRGRVGKILQKFQAGAQEWSNYSVYIDDNGILPCAMSWAATGCNGTAVRRAHGLTQPRRIEARGSNRKGAGEDSEEAF